MRGYFRRVRFALNSEFQCFSVYGFSIDYLKGSHVEFNPKSREVEGDVAFHLPERVKVFLSWGDLAKTAGFQTVGNHVDHSLSKVKAATNVRNFEQISRTTIQIRSHEAVYTRTRFDEIIVGLLSGRSKKPREGHSVHLHCINSARYFVVYGILPKEGTYSYEGAFQKMARSLKCH